MSEPPDRGDWFAERPEPETPDHDGSAPSPTASPFVCDVCDGRGLIRVDVDPDTGVWDGEDCWGCNGTGDPRNHDDSPHNSANYPNRDSA